MFVKLTDRNNRTKSNMISVPHEFYWFLAKHRNEVTNLFFANDDVVWASWCFIAY